MTDFIEGVLANLLQNYGLDTAEFSVKWVEDNVPPIVPMVLIFGTLLVCYSIAAYRGWKRNGSVPNS